MTSHIVDFTLSDCANVRSTYRVGKRGVCLWAQLCVVALQFVTDGERVVRRQMLDICMYEFGRSEYRRHGAARGVR